MNTNNNINGIMKVNKMRQIKKIHMLVIPHEKQRYETVGDYFFDTDDVLQIRTSKLPNNRMELLVLLHEIIEVLLTEYRGIKEQDIYDFDVDFESKRPEGNIDEPGDDSKAPYKKEHCIATSVERMMASLLEVDWNDYDKACQECE
jgi:hypothetical protein